MKSSRDEEPDNEAIFQENTSISTAQNLSLHSQKERERHQHIHYFIHKYTLLFNLYRTFFYHTFLLRLRHISSSTTVPALAQIKSVDSFTYC